MSTRRSRSSARPRSAAARAGVRPALRGPTPGPSMAELRRRASRQLREIARLLAVVQSEYAAAAAECDRLRAARPEANPDAAPALSDGEQRERLRERVSALQEKLRETDSALAGAQARNRELQARVRALEAGGERLEKRAAADGWSGETAGLQAELRRARLANNALQQDMENLLRFLGELAGMLGPPSEGQGST